MLDARAVALSQVFVRILMAPENAILSSQVCIHGAMGFQITRRSIVYCSKPSPMGLEVLPKVMLCVLDGVPSAVLSVVN